MLGLIVDPEGVVYRVRPGTTWAKVTARFWQYMKIGLTLVELVPDGAGGWIERDATVALDDQ